jgi:hypothetical protein
MVQKTVDPARLVQVVVPSGFQKDTKRVWVIASDLDEGKQYPNTYSVHGNIKTSRGRFIPINRDMIIEVLS